MEKSRHESTLETSAITSLDDLAKELGVLESPEMQLLREKMKNLARDGYTTGYQFKEYVNLARKSVEAQYGDNPKLRSKAEIGVEVLLAAMLKELNLHDELENLMVRIRYMAECSGIAEAIRGLVSIERHELMKRISLGLHDNSPF